MDRRHACEMVKMLLESVKTHFQQGDEIWLSISRILDVNLLRKEILSLLASKSETVLDLAKHLDWGQLVGGLLSMLKGYPVVCEKEWDVSLEKYIDYRISGLKLVEENNRICWEIVSADAEAKNTRIVGELPKLLNPM